MSTDLIKTALRFRLTQLDEAFKMTSITFMTSISAIFMERYVNKQTDEKKIIYNKIHCDSGDGSSVIPVAVV